MFSKTYLGAIILLLSAVLKKFGIELGDADQQKIIDAATELIGLALVFYGRYAAGGITVLGTRTDK